VGSISKGLLEEVEVELWKNLMGIYTGDTGGLVVASLSCHNSAQRISTPVASRPIRSSAQKYHKESHAIESYATYLTMKDILVMNVK